MRKFLIALLFTAGGAFATTVDDSVRKAAEAVGVPYKLLKAICTAESGLQPSAYVHNDGGRGDAAFGLCQVLASTAKNFGFHDENCFSKDFTKLPKNYETCKLFGPYINSYYAAKVLRYQLRRYNGSWISAIAAYNTGSVKICLTGKVRRRSDRKVVYTCQKGGLLNQKYVDRVLLAIQKE